MGDQSREGTEPTLAGDFGRRKVQRSGVWGTVLLERMVKRMLLEIRFLGLRLILTPETVEALLDFTAAWLGWSVRCEESASSESQALT